jgi:hypothetical protein
MVISLAQSTAITYLETMYSPIRVTEPITDLLTEHFYIYFHHMCFIFNDLNVMGVLPRALEIVYEVQMKRSNEKITSKIISFPTYKGHFIFIFFLFGPFLFSNLITFLFFIHFKQFKMLSEQTPEALQIIFEL